MSWAGVGRKAGVRVVVCGSRTWSDPRTIGLRLQQLPPNAVVITGGARGADLLANEAAEMLHLDRIIVPANWKGYGRSAGPRRNRLMLDLGPDLVIAFRASGRSPGTDDMIRAAKQRGVEVEVVRP